MKTRFNCKLFIILWMVSGMQYITPQEWNGGSVKDTNLVINSDITINNDQVFIESELQDITIEFNSGSVEGNGSDSGLHFKVAAGHTITILINEDAEFRGANGSPLLIVQSGDGQVIWEIANGHQIIFNDTQYFLSMLLEDADIGPDEYENASSSFIASRVRAQRLFNRASALAVSAQDYENPRPVEPAPSAIFRRQTSVANRFTVDENDVAISLENGSILGFLSDEPIGSNQETAAFIFDPATDDETSLMILNIEDGSTVLTTPRKIIGNPSIISFDDIVLSQLAGGNALFLVQNSAGPNAPANLFIINRNNTVSEFLFDPFLTLGTRNSSTNYTGSFSGQQYGFIVGPNGELRIGDNASIQYVGTTLNEQPVLFEVPGFSGIAADALLKPRNASALTFDQSHNPLALTPRLTFGSSSALFLRSGVDNQGNVRELSDAHPFTVSELSSADEFPNFVFINEGDVEVSGVDSRQAKIELLSLEVTPTGGSLFASARNGNFAQRTFAQEDDMLVRYNRGAFLINGHLNLENVSLVHTNENAQVFARDDINSEPTFIGGDTFKLLDDSNADQLERILMRPKIELINSRFILNRSAALTGVDLTVPNHVEDAEICEPNSSEIVFGFNGFNVDNGNGTNLVLGTQLGSTGGDNMTVIDADAHLDVIQTEECFGMNNPTDAELQTLRLTTAPNNRFIVEEIGNTNINNQLATHSIFLGNNSNISVGSNSDMSQFFEETNPTLEVAGNFFSFDTRGGSLNDPTTSPQTGQGGIFVDRNGTFRIGALFSATMNTQIVRSRNGVVDFPEGSVVFGPDVGITVSNIDLTDPNSRVIVRAGEHVAKLYLDWASINRSTNDRQRDNINFVPYPIGQNNMSGCAPVTAANITNVPTIEGDVDQLFITGSRLSDPAHVKVKGGTVGEVAFIINNEIPGEAPVAVIILEDEGTVGLGSTGQEVGNATPAVNIGKNGVVFIANRGGGNVTFNSSVSIVGQCPFLFGPDVQEGDELNVSSLVSNTLSVANGTTLDLRSVMMGNILSFNNDIVLELFPATSVVLGGGTLRFKDNAQVNVIPAANVQSFFNSIPLGSIDNSLNPLTPTRASDPHNEFAPLTNFREGLRNTDPFRVRLIGEGVLEFNDESQMSIPRNAFVGVETLSQLLDSSTGLEADIPVTDITLRINDDAQINLGEGLDENGGALQVGNVQNNGSDHSVSFVLELNGNNSQFNLGSQAFLGLNAGVVSQNRVLNDTLTGFLTDTLNNVSAVTINLNNGVFNASHIWPTDDIRSNLIALGSNNGNSPRFTLARTPSSVGQMNGGSPLALITRGNSSNAGAIDPIIRTDDDQVVVGQNPNGTPIFSQRFNAGMLASSQLQTPNNTVSEVSARAFFEAIRSQNQSPIAATPAQDRANAGVGSFGLRDTLETIRVGTVSNDVIVRNDITNINNGTADQEANRQQAVRTGAVFARVNAQGQIVSASQIPV